MAGGGRPQRDYDVVVVGSGFGGAFAALPLVRAGARVLMLERGEWVARGPQNWGHHGSLALTPHVWRRSPCRVLSGGEAPLMGTTACVGGASVFYGGVSLRFRTADFERRPEIAESGAEWPFPAAELTRFYAAAERILGVAGAAGADPTEPLRDEPYPSAPAPWSGTSALVAAAGARLGLRPFPLPLAINRDERPARSTCRACTTCDTYACAVSAKNDVATAVLPGLVQAGLEIRTGAVARRILKQGRRVSAVQVVDVATGRVSTVRAGRVILAAGALGSPHLLLASGLPLVNPAGDAVGRYLTRHCAGIVYGVFRSLPDDGAEFHKQVGFHDFYHGGDGGPAGHTGVIQQVQSPPEGLVRARLPFDTGGLLRPLLSRMTGLLVLAEDQPERENRVAVDADRSDGFGLPQLVVRHRHTRRDVQARGALLRHARAILKEAGALAFYTHHIQTFSHASGTVRMGPNARTAPLDEWCSFRGVDNLSVVDASAFPTAGGVNPSLTIAALALRAGERLAREAA
jgi:choline dehydrogenase-like flavoprotein